MITGVNHITLSVRNLEKSLTASDLNTRIKSAKASPWEGLEFFI